MGGDGYPSSSPPLLPAHKHRHYYLQLCIRGFYLLFSIAAHAVTTLLLDEIYPPKEISISLVFELRFDC